MLLTERPRHLRHGALGEALAAVDELQAASHHAVHLLVGSARKKTIPDLSRTFQKVLTWRGRQP